MPLHRRELANGARFLQPWRDNRGALESFWKLFLRMDTPLKGGFMFDVEPGFREGSQPSCGDRRSAFLTQAIGSCLKLCQGMLDLNKAIRQRQLLDMHPVPFGLVQTLISLICHLLTALQRVSWLINAFGCPQGRDLLPEARAFAFQLSAQLYDGSL
jgi:hypothetical protein